MNRVIHKNQKGIGLVEVIAALGVTVVVITALVSLSVFTLRASLQSKLLLEGTKLASRETELVRAYRDKSISWQAFVDDMAGCFTACSVDLTADSFLASPRVEGAGLEAVTRQFKATTINGAAISVGSTTQVVRISVTASWNVGDDLKQTHVYTDLTNWRGL